MLVRWVVGEIPLTMEQVDPVIEELLEISREIERDDSRGRRHIVDLYPRTAKETRSLMSAYVQQSMAGAVDPVLQRYAARTFDAALRGESKEVSPEQLLGLKEPVGHRPRNDFRGWKVCVLVASMRDRGSTLSSALEAVAAEMNISVENTKRIYYRYKDSYPQP